LYILSIQNWTDPSSPILSHQMSTIISSHVYSKQQQGLLKCSQ